MAALQPLMAYLTGLESRIAVLEGGAPLPSAAPSAAATSAPTEDSRQVQDFDALLKGAPATLAAVSAKIGGDCATLVRGGGGGGRGGRCARACAHAAR